MLSLLEVRIVAVADSGWIAGAAIDMAMQTATNTTAAEFIFEKQRNFWDFTEQTYETQMMKFLRNAINLYENSMF